jgi:hypothetical protein
MKPPPGGRLLMAVVWIAAISAISGPIVFLVQTVLKLATGRWPDWTAWGVPLGYVLIVSTLLAAAVLVLAFQHINRFLQRRYDRRRLSGQVRT